MQANTHPTAPSGGAVLPSAAAPQLHLPSSASAGGIERQALRAALVRLLDAEERLPHDYLPALDVAPDPAALALKNRYRERRLGSAAMGTDLLDSGSSALAACSAPVVLPADRLATSVVFAAYADPSISRSAEAGGETAGGAMSAAVAQQREQHRWNLALQGAHAGEGNK